MSGDDIWCKQKYIDGQPWLVHLHDSTHDDTERTLDIDRALRTFDGAFVLCDVAEPIEGLNDHYSLPMMRFVERYYNQLQRMIHDSAVPPLFPGTQRSPDSLVYIRGDFPVFLLGTQTDKDDRKFSRKQRMECA
jgi:hypothetical protein